MDKMKWIIFAVIVVIIFGGVIWLSKSDNQEFTGDASTVITDGPIADHVIGAKDNKVMLIEYGDYQCPGCRSMAEPVNLLTETYKDKLTFVFRHMPLTNIHPNALAAATAAEAAGLQGKYYEMHDILFLSQDNWKGASVDDRAAVFEGYASQLGLNMDKFKQDVNSKDVTTKINRDRATGRKFGVNQTPSFVLNGKLLDAKTSTDQAALKKVVEDALKAAYPDFTPVEQTAQP